MKLLLIDDDKASMRYYIQELKEHNIEVRHERDTDAALSAVKEEGAKFDLIILDSAMAAGNAYAASQTDAGTLTGKFLFRDIRNMLPETPILILTNFMGLEWIQEACRQLKVGAERKIDLLPSQLVDRVKEMIRVAWDQERGRK